MADKSLTNKQEEISIDMSKAKTPGMRSPTGGHTKERRSRPSEAYYKKRKQWWIDHKFGTEAAAWAASWRLGRPRTTRKLTKAEAIAVDRAIEIGERRPDRVRAAMRSYKKRDGTLYTEKETIKRLDRNLRLMDMAAKSRGGIIQISSINSAEVESNIFKDESF